jgi:hypothetical protein
MINHFSHFIGVDPGRHGALAVLDSIGALVLLVSLPTVPQAGFIKTRLDAVALLSLLNARLIPDCEFPPRGECDASGGYPGMLAAVESVWVRPTDSNASGAALVQSAALAEGVLVGLGATVIRPTPQLGDATEGRQGQGRVSEACGGSVARRDVGG